MTKFKQALLLSIQLSPFLLYLLPFLWVWGNYEGVCYAQRRILSKEEKINIILHDLNDIKHHIIVNKELVLPISRPSFDQVLKDNPHCCEFGWLKSQGEEKFPTLSDRLLGNVSDLVSVHYNYQYRSLDSNVDEIKQVNLQAWIWLDSCGKWVNNW